jgi:hypothetical protein
MEVGNKGRNIQIVLAGAIELNRRARDRQKGRGGLGIAENLAQIG